MTLTDVAGVEGWGWAGDCPGETDSPVWLMEFPCHWMRFDAEAGIVEDLSEDFRVPTPSGGVLRLFEKGGPTLGTTPARHRQDTGTR